MLSTTVLSQTRLINAIKNLEQETAINLINSGVDVNEYIAHSENHEHNNKCIGHDYNRSPLFWAVLKNDYKIVKLLIEKGADVNFKNAHGKTALHIATQAYNNKIVDLLIKNNAKVDLTDEFGNTALFLASYNYTIETNLEIKNRIKKVIILLLENNANKNINNTKNKKPIDFKIIQDLTI